MRCLVSFFHQILIGIQNKLNMVMNKEALIFLYLKYFQWKFYLATTITTTTVTILSPDTHHCQDIEFIKCIS